MAKFRYDSKNESFEWEGTPQELLVVYDGLKQRLENSIQPSNNVPRQYDPMSRALIFQKAEQELAKKMPTIEQLVNYIMAKPKFEHDIIDVELKFFGKQIQSRQYGRLYRLLKARLELARKGIEASQHGAFERRSARPRNLQAYSFKPINSVLFGQPSQRTS